MGDAFGRLMSRYPERFVVHGPTTKYSVFRENACVLVHAHHSFSEHLGYLSVQVSPCGDRRELHSFPLSCSPREEESCVSAPGLAPKQLLVSCKGTLGTPFVAVVGPRVAAVFAVVVIMVACVPRPEVTAQCQRPLDEVGLRSTAPCMLRFPQRLPDGRVRYEDTKRRYGVLPLSAPSMETVRHSPYKGHVTDPLTLLVGPSVSFLATSCAHISYGHLGGAENFSTVTLAVHRICWY